MEDEFDGAGEALNFKYSGRFDKERRVLLFSPFFPFNVKLAETFFERFRDDKTVNIYSSTVLDKRAEFGDYIEEFERVIEQVGENRLVLIGFGFFSSLFIHLAEKYKSRTTTLILFEPDFSNQSLVKIFDFDKKPFFTFSYLVKYFCKGKVARRFLERGNVKRLKGYYNTSRGHVEQNKTIKDMINEDMNIHIFWNVMERESWPLAQILGEEYELPLYTFKEDIYETLQKGDPEVLESVKKILG